MRERVNAVTRNGERYVAPSIGRALESLDHTWDNYFQYNKPAEEKVLS
jgi:hypothetical protein